MKVVINRCCGGFGLSHAAYEALVKRGWTVTQYTPDGNMADPSADLVLDDDKNGWNKRLGRSPYYWGKWSGSDLELRTHPDLIAVVEELGQAANGQCAELKVVEIPFDRCEGWEIDDYDGREKIEQTHQSWD